MVQFDTGSSDLWVHSAVCRPQDCLNVCNSTYPRVCKNPKYKYISSSSSTYRHKGTDIALGYGSGCVRGFLSNDTVEIAGVQLPWQVFAEITCGSGITYSSPDYDGILGLAFPSKSTTDRPVFYKLVENGIISEPVFSFWLSRNPKAKYGGELILGGVDPARYTGKITYVKLSDVGFWKFNFTGITVLSNPKLSFCQNGCKTIIDSGTSLILGPNNTINEIHSRIGAVPFLDVYRVDCSNVGKLPIIYFKIAGSNFPLLPTDYTFKYTHNSGVTVCLSGFQGTNGEEWILGDVFMRAYYSIHDILNQRVGLARAR